MKCSLLCVQIFIIFLVLDLSKQVRCPHLSKYNFIKSHVTILIWFEFKLRCSYTVVLQDGERQGSF